MAIAKKKAKTKQSGLAPKLYFAVRIRGAPGMRRKILDTLFGGLLPMKECLLNVKIIFLMEKLMKKH
jgi:hypothetical protein